MTSITKLVSSPLVALKVPDMGLDIYIYIITDNVHFFAILV